MRDISGSLARQAYAVAAVCLVADAGLFLIGGPPLSLGWQAWVVLLGGILANAALAGPSRYSGWVSAAHAALLVAAPLLLFPYDHYLQATNAGVLIAGYRAGAWLSAEPALASLATMLAGLVACNLIPVDRGDRDWRLLIIDVGVSGLLPWMVGRYTTARRAYIADLQRAEDQRQQHETEAVRRAVIEERTTIARDLHDVISHHVSAIGVHAGAARLGLPDGEPVVRRSLSAVESSSRAAMADLRRLLDLLHGKENGDAQRQPGLDNLDELLENLRIAGLPTRMTSHGGPRELPGSVDIALYRIAQEALTNALRHGLDSVVEIDLAYRQTEVVLTITNEIGRPSGGSSAESTKRGLAGIRQRVALFGGHAECGPLDDGRHWRVRVGFPLEAE
ncbi:sensor histidine kinase [Amycolatopsis regifaucium]|uniref:histidine kinase n=1 Tax=Amycolatopsis regifaucium TaxID=546365 RepID=A0A154MN18_9PSEU|nr:histidine kinase [Amycolatopsis regifaucium]KZB85237.1 histidine kinase [Amycolatopsis regifaucium]OKA03785.1 two-component sensor histidine kinase [Amycolatopsis regifaucium]SFH89363.1 Signal transduction histidine kinase [Amycolatopsis regifaucium]